MAETGRYELRIMLPASSREDAVALARKAYLAVGEYAQSVTVYEEQMVEPTWVYCGSTGKAR